METSTKITYILSLVLPPVRITTIIFLLKLFTPLEISWESAIQFFYWFPAVYVGSFFGEGILVSKSSSYRTALAWIFPKYMQSLPLEFVGVYVFTMASFFPSSESVHNLEIEKTMQIIGIIVAIELFHHYVQPHLKKIPANSPAGMVTFVFLTILIFFASLYAFLRFN